jgi:MFS family permease
MRGHRSALVIVFIVVFIDLLGFGIVLPLLPLYGEEFIAPLVGGDPQSSAHKAVAGLLLGLLMASFSLMQFIFSPIWGRISDRVGRRPILLMGLTGSVLFYALFGFASLVKSAGFLVLAVVLLFVARIGAGIAGATIATAQAVIADSTPPERRAHGMALIGIAFGIGFTFGPLLGFGSLFIPVQGVPGQPAAGLSAGAVEGMPGYLASSLSAVALLVGFFQLPETLRNNDRAERRSWIANLRAIPGVLRLPSVGLLVLTFFLAVIAFANFESTLALLNKALLMPEANGPAVGSPGDAPSTSGTNAAGSAVQLSKRQALKTTEKINFLGFAYVGFVLMMAQGFVYRRFVSRVGEIRFMRLGLLLMALGLAGVSAVAILATDRFLESRSAILTSGLAVLTLAVVGFSLLNPSVPALVSRRTDRAVQGEVLGVLQSASALSRIIGPVVGISLFGLTQAHVLPYAVGTVLLLTALALSLRVRPGADAART